MAVPDPQGDQGVTDPGASVVLPPDNASLLATPPAEWEAYPAIIDVRFLHQTINVHRPGEGKVGDCWRTAIACLLGAPDPTVVPHFMEQVMHLSPLGGWEATRLARTWLRAETVYDLMEVNLAYAKSTDLPYIAAVHSKTGDWTHCVIARGDQVIHDPSGIDGYTLDDIARDTVDMIVTPYTPDPDEMVRQWAEQEAAEKASHAGASRVPTTESGSNRGDLA